MTSPLAKTNERACALRESVKKYKDLLKDEKLSECLVVSSHVPTPKHEAKHRYVSRKQVFVSFLKQLKELLLGYISVLSFVF